MIQARWRAFHVRRKKLNMACTIIQKWVRGYPVRLVNQRHNAAVVIQRHFQGKLVRRRLAEANTAATQIQKKVRGNNARVWVKNHAKNVLKASIALQQGIRMWKANKIASEKRKAKEDQEIIQQAAITIQSTFRGNKGRKKFDEYKRKYIETVQENDAATRIQAITRRMQARTRVDTMRSMRLANMSSAATIMRKHYLCYLYRKRFLELRKEFLIHENSIITMQRYVRGYLVRLRMWRDAIRAEEELWAAVEIQRCWRGYMGRIRWEAEYEAVWSREAAAQRIQRHVRGWLARTSVHRLRKKIARAEFEKARRRFKAAQKIQAFMRGCQARKRIQAFRARKIDATITIQRIYRGHLHRVALWERTVAKRTIQIQAIARGFLVRTRRFHLIAKIILIQRCWRHWLNYVPEEERQRRVDKWRQRRQAVRANMR